MVKETVTKCITILKEQQDAIDAESRYFNLSHFVQEKLSEYFKILNEYRQFMEVED